MDARGEGLRHLAHWFLIGNMRMKERESLVEAEVRKLKPKMRLEDVF